jgi:hypothetical protein
MNTDSALFAPLYAQWASEDEEDTIEAKADEICQPGEACYPYESSNLFESIGSMKDDQIENLASLLADGTFEQVGAYLNCITTDYWGEKARELAEEMLNDAESEAASSRYESERETE